MNPVMCERGRTTYRIFNKLVDVLKSGDADSTIAQGWPPEDDEDAVMAIAPPKGAKAPPTRLVRNPRVDDSHLYAMQRRNGKSRDLFLGHHSAQQDESSSVKGKTPVRQPDAKAAAITS